jgi:hypothetical protein
MPGPGFVIAGALFDLTAWVDRAQRDRKPRFRLIVSKLLEKIRVICEAAPNARRNLQVVR